MKVQQVQVWLAIFGGESSPSVEFHKTEEAAEAAVEECEDPSYPQRTKVTSRWLSFDSDGNFLGASYWKKEGS